MELFNWMYWYGRKTEFTTSIISKLFNLRNYQPTMYYYWVMLSLIHRNEIIYMYVGYIPIYLSIESIKNWFSWNRKVRNVINSNIFLTLLYASNQFIIQHYWKLSMKYVIYLLYIYWRIINRSRQSVIKYINLFQY